MFKLQTLYYDQFNRMTLFFLNKMVDANPHGERPEEKPPKADEKSSKLKELVPLKKLLIESHCGINHFAYCNKNNCKRCSWVGLTISILITL